MTKNTTKEQLDLPEIERFSLSEQGKRLEKIRCALSVQICGQLQQLNTELFDKIDDSLFSSSSSAQVGDRYGYLKAIREFRNKKVLFEETLLGSLRIELESILYLADNPKLADNPESSIVKSSELDSENEPSKFIEALETKETVFERMEIDLALNGMQRRALRLYAPLTGQLNGIFDGELCFGSPNLDENEDYLVCAVARALDSSRGVLSVPVDLKLIFIKHFELSLVMKMEMVYLGLINVLKNQSDTEFMEQFCSSVELVQKGHNALSNSDEDQLQSNESIRDSKNSLEIVRQSAQAAIKDLCGKTKIPLFMEKMVKNDWQNVMVLTGLNQGVESDQWKEAIQVVKSLFEFLLGSNDKTPNNEFSNELKNQIKQGFALIQLSESEQSEFFNSIEDDTVIPQEARTVLDTSLTASHITQGEKSEVKVAISKAGRKILDDDDLDDIVALLSDDPGQKKQKEKDETDDSLSCYLDMIDGLRDGEEIEFVNGGKVQKCKIEKSVTGDNSFKVTDRAGKVLLARSRVGLALSAKAGELRISGNSTIKPQPAVDQRTILQAKTAIDPPTTH